MPNVTEAELNGTFPIHPMCGKRVKVLAEGREPERVFTVGRVRAERYGEYAYSQENPEERYLLRKCIPL